MVIVGENWYGDRVRVLDEAVCILHSANAIGKGMNLIIPPPATGKQ